MEDIVDALAKALKPVLKSQLKGKRILEKFWSDKAAIVWSVQDVFRAANERQLVLTRSEAKTILREFVASHSKYQGLEWWGLLQKLEVTSLGRKITKSELKRFIEKDVITIQK